jgi:carboxypeptidase Q
MKKFLLLGLALPALASATPPVMPPGPPPSPPAAGELAASLRDEALARDTYAWDIVEGLTTEVGPRLAGTEAEARARAWAVRKLNELGFSNVRVEEFDMPVWVRGEEKGEILSPFPQPLMLTALGNSGATPARGIEAEVVGFANMAALEAARPETVRGKIVFVTHRMGKTQDGSHYGYFGAARRQGPSVASAKGAAAIVIRSIGTDSHRFPHTGVQSWAEGVKPIPAAALSNPDADQMERLLARGRPVRMKLTLTPRQIGTRKSGNVIAEVPGRDPSAGIVLVGGHLDSWDLGTGAIDDGAGVAITAAAAKRIMDAGGARRTIRVVWFGAEEVGLFGGNDYRKRHANELHASATESDFGADRIWRVDFALPPAAAGVANRVEAALAPLGIARGPNPARGGPDIGALVNGGVPAVTLQQDGTDYFDLHHTPDDTLDKIDLAKLRQNVAAYTAMMAIVADAPENWGHNPPRQ